MDKVNDKYTEWTLVKLVAELKKRKVKSTGKKKDLIERLQSLDILGISYDAVGPGFNMTQPDADSYNDLNSASSVPTVPFSRIEQYFDINEKKFEPKYYSMYYEGYMRYLRVSSDRSDGVYFTGNVWAEMRKSTNYKVDVKFDENVVVSEAQCECSAGEGPTAHCKHVACVLYGVHCFTDNGYVITDKTCTETLQTFHLPTKSYRGSPIKGAAMQDLREQAVVYDPRPPEFRNTAEYPDYFRNVVLSYQSDHKVPVQQLYEPANPYALNNDHDYAGSLEDAFFESSKLRTITEEEAANLETMTRGQSTNGKWKSERSLRITASNFGTISKATVRRDMEALARDMVTPKAFRSKATDHGRIYEAVAVEKFVDEFGPTNECGLFVHKDMPWLGASPDRVLDLNALLEVKCPYSARDHMISPLTVPYLRSVNGDITLSQTHDYFYQCQGQMMCSNRNLCYFCVFTFCDFKIIRIKRDDMFISDMTVKLNSFYENFFKSALLEKHVYKFYGKYF